MKTIFRILGIAVVLLLISHFVPGITVSDFYIALIVAVLWGLTLLIVRPILGLITLPINVLTLGLFSFVLNALLFWFLATFVQGFSVSGFIPALEASVLLVLVGWALDAIL